MIGLSGGRDAARASSGCSNTCAASSAFGFAAVSISRTTGAANLQSLADRVGPWSGDKPRQGALPSEGFAQKFAARPLWRIDRKRLGHGEQTATPWPQLWIRKTVPGAHSAGGRRMKREDSQCGWHIDGG